MTDERFVGGEHVRIRSGVRRVRRPGVLMLLPAAGRPVVVSPLVDEIWDSLVAGIAVSDLARELGARRPRAADIGPKLKAFLDRLWAAGVLEGSGLPAQSVHPVIEIPIDPLARRIAFAIGKVPGGLAAAVLGLLAILSLCGFVAMLAQADHPRLRNLLGHLTIWNVLLVLLVLVPLHELGHAVACRWAGVPSGPLAVRLGRFGIPRPYVDTSQAWSVEDPRKRGWIPAGGPLMDLVAGGTAAWALVAFGSSGALGSIAWLVGLYAIIAVNVGTSPILAGDGSHMIEALLDDDFARGAALLGRSNPFVRRHSVAIYRSASIAHLACSSMLIVLLR